MLRTVEITQAMFSQVHQASTGRKLSIDQTGCRMREQDLPAMSDSSEPRAAIDCQAVVVPLTQLKCPVWTPMRTLIARGVGQSSAANTRWMATAAAAAPGAEAKTAKREVALATGPNVDPAMSAYRCVEESVMPSERSPHRLWGRLP